MLLLRSYSSLLLVYLLRFYFIMYSEQSQFIYSEDIYIPTVYSLGSLEVTKILIYLYSLPLNELELNYSRFIILDWLLQEGVSIVEGVISTSEPFFAYTNLLYKAGITKLSSNVRLCNLSYPYNSPSAPFQIQSNLRARFGLLLEPFLVTASQASNFENNFFYRSSTLFKDEGLALAVFSGMVLDSILRLSLALLCMAGSFISLLFLIVIIKLFINSQQQIKPKVLA